MRFGYTILYVRDVAASLEFYERAFDQKRRFLHESGQYAELETGATTLAFAGRELAALSVPAAFQPPEADSSAPAFEVCFVTDDVQAAFTRAVRPAPPRRASRCASRGARRSPTSATSTTTSSRSPHPSPEPAQPLTRA